VNRRQLRIAIYTLGTAAAAALGSIALLPAHRDDAAALLRQSLPAALQRATVAGWSGHLTALAGDGMRGLQDGPAATARFADPYGVAIDRQGNMFVTDAGDNNRIRRIGTDGSVATLAGGTEGFADGTGTQAAFHTPSGIAIDRDGNLYVADTGNHAIRKVTPQGVVTTVAGNGRPGFRDGAARDAQFDGPIGVAVGKDGSLWIADTYNDRIRRIAPDGTVSTVAGGALPGLRDGVGSDAMFDTPAGIAVDRRGHALVADLMNHAIRRVSPDGVVTTLAAAGPERDAPLRRPLSVAVTHDGHAYVGEAGRGRIVQLTPEGATHILRQAAPDDAAHADFRFKRPAGLAVARDGSVIVADAVTKLVRRMSDRPEQSATRVAHAASAAPAAVSAPLPPAAQPLPWPLRPQDGWHEIVGTMGEVRGAHGGDNRDHFHGGVDVQGPMGSTVVAIIAEKVASPAPNWAHGDLNEGISLDTMSYIHMRVGRGMKDEILDPQRFSVVRDAAGRTVRVRVRRGTRFAVGEPLGTINRMYHVHLNFEPNGTQTNPLLLGFPGLADRIPPTIDDIRLVDASGKPLGRKQRGKLVLPRAQADAVGIVVDAWDQVDRNQPRRKLGLYRLGYQVLHADGRPVDGYGAPVVTMEFDRLPDDRDAVKIAYAGDSGDNVYRAARTRFLYMATNVVRDGKAMASSWQASKLAPGEYIVRILAEDFAGNAANRRTDLAVTIE